MRITTDSGCLSRKPLGVSRHSGRFGIEFAPHLDRPGAGDNQKGQTPMDPNKVQGAKPPKPGPAFEIVRLRAGQRLEGFILSDTLYGFLTHWIKRGKKGFSVECTKGKKACYCEKEELPTR